MSQQKSTTTLTWVDTTKDDCYIINSWSDEKQLTIKTESTRIAVDKLNKFLNASPTNGIGTSLIPYIKKQPGDFYYYDEPLNVNDQNKVGYGVKSAYYNGELIGFVAYDSTFSQTTGKTEYLILKYAVNPELQGRGFATAMFMDMKKAPQLIFGVDHCKVSMMVDIENVGCRKVISKVGAKIDTEKMEKMKVILKGLQPKMEEFVMYADGRIHEQIAEVIDTVIAAEKQTTQPQPIKTSPIKKPHGKGKE